jgi:hypothetical protein
LEFGVMTRASAVRHSDFKVLAVDIKVPRL